MIAFFKSTFFVISLFLVSFTASANDYVDSSYGCDSLMNDANELREKGEIFIFGTENYHNVDFKLAFSDNIKGYSVKVKEFIDLVFNNSLHGSSKNRYCNSLLEQSRRDKKNIENFNRHYKNIVENYVKIYRRNVKILDVKGCEKVAHKVSDLFLELSDDETISLYKGIYKNCLKRNFEG